MEQQLVTLTEVAALLNCGRTTIWRKVKAGTMPAPLKVCGLTRWRAGDIAALIEGSAPAKRVVPPRIRQRRAA